MSETGARWSDACLAIRLAVVDPRLGLHLRAPAGPVRDRWLRVLKAAWPAAAPLQKIPAGIGDDRLIGGLDLAATLKAVRPVINRGLLAQADGGGVLLAMAERLPAETASRIAAVMDERAVRLERDGFSAITDTRFAVIALDEGEDGEGLHAALAERLALSVDLHGLRLADARAEESGDMQNLAGARGRLGGIGLADDIIDSLCAACLALGIASLRTPLQALDAARAHAALEGRTMVSDDDLAVAARLVLAPRAIVLPPAADDEAQDRDDELADDTSNDTPSHGPDKRSLDDMLVEAARGAMPRDALAALGGKVLRRVAGGRAGRSGDMMYSGARGRPTTPRMGRPGRMARLNIPATLRAAAPWQSLRRDRRTGAPDSIVVSPDDFRVATRKGRAETATIFVVDASGSTALNRLAEAKGAVELLLAESYARRDQVALIAFRGTKADIALAPTRSLTRARRMLASLPGGGGTPLASGIVAAARLAMDVQRRGRTPTLVIMTDGRANVALDGTQGRAQAQEDTTTAALHIKALGARVLLVDVSPRPQLQARELADTMGAHYLPLPLADATRLSQAVKGSHAV